MTRWGVCALVFLLGWGGVSGSNAGVIYDSFARIIAAYTEAIVDGAPTVSGGDKQRPYNWPEPFVATVSGEASTVNPSTGWSATGESMASIGETADEFGFTITGAVSASAIASPIGPGAMTWGAAQSQSELYFTTDSPMIFAGTVEGDDSYVSLILQEGGLIGLWPGSFSIVIPPGSYVALGVGWARAQADGPTSAFGAYNIWLTPEPASGLLLAFAGLVGLRRR